MGFTLQCRFQCLKDQPEQQHLGNSNSRTRGGNNGDRGCAFTHGATSGATSIGVTDKSAQRPFCINVVFY